MVYRGTEPKMSGYLHEWRAAQTEGCVARWQTQPTGFESEGGRVTGVQCIKVDENKQLVPGTEHVIAADLVLLAIGQSKLGNTLAGIEGIHVEWGRLVVDADQATDRPGVYAVGDCANGGKEVVNAAAEGKRAAEAIHAFLNGGGK
jgi:glutamate synthase (NADPH/NADH) small chain